MTEPKGGQSVDMFSRGWLLVVILCMVPPFFLFAASGDPGRGRAAAIVVGVCATVIRARWKLRKHLWFWATTTVLVALNVLLVLLVPWSGKSYPGYELLPLALLDFGVMYGCFKLIERIARGSGDTRG